MEEVLTEELLNGINTIMVKLKEVPLRLSLEVRVQNKGRGQALLSFNAKNGHDYKIFAKRLRGEGNWEEARIILEDFGKWAERAMIVIQTLGDEDDLWKFQIKIGNRLIETDPLLVYSKKRQGDNADLIDRPSLNQSQNTVESTAPTKSAREMQSTSSLTSLGAGMIQSRLFALGVVSLIPSLCLDIRRFAAVRCLLFASGGLAKLHRLSLPRVLVSLIPSLCLGIRRSAAIGCGLWAFGGWRRGIKDPFLVSWYLAVGDGWLFAFGFRRLKALYH